MKIETQLLVLVATLPETAAAEQRFKFGDVVVNDAARRDILRGDGLLPGPDRAHLAVSADGRLGYDVGHANPDDPFRWRLLRDIVDQGHVSIRAVAPGYAFPVIEVRGRGRRTLVMRSLLDIRPGAAGLTLARESVAAIGGYPYVTSPESGRDRIYYVAGDAFGAGAGVLAHELYGHLWLATRGAPFEHGGTLAGAAADVPDPFGTVYVGDVDAFIARLAASTDGALVSPTQHVGPALLAESLRAFAAQAAAPGGLVRRPDDGWAVSRALGRAWELLSNNYAVLTIVDAAAAAALVDDLAALYARAGGDQQYALTQFLRTLAAAPAGRRGRRAELAEALARRLAVDPESPESPESPPGVAHQ